MDAEVVLARVEEKLDAITNHIKDVREDVKDHESRLRHVEHKIWAMSGIATLLSTVSASSIVYILVR